MTNQEASKIIKDGIEDMSLDFADEEQYEALNMAIKAIEQESSGDLISRQAVFNILLKYTLGESRIAEELKELPSVNPQEKTGHWIEDDMTYCGVDLTNYKCDKCGEIGGSWRKGLKPDKLPKYCMNCGCRMVEPQERSEKNE